MNLVVLSLIGSALLILYYVLNAYFYYMVLMIILSWIPGIQEKGWYQSLSKISDAYIGRFRGLIVIGYLDFTPIIGFAFYELVLMLLGNVILPAVM